MASQSELVSVFGGRGSFFGIGIGIGIGMDYLRAPTGTVSVTIGTPFTKSCRALWFDVGGNVNISFTDGTSGTFTVVASQRFEGSIAGVNITGTTMLGSQIHGLL